MDELLRDFLAESAEQLEAVKAQLTRVDFDSVDPRASDGAWRRIHAIKGACGFLNLPRLEAIAHAAEALVGSMSDAVAPKRTAVSLILEAIDRMSFVLAGLAEARCEPPGDDGALIARLEAAARRSPGSWRGACDGAPLLETPLDAASTPPERRVDAIRVSLQSIERIDCLVADLIMTRNQLLADRGQRRLRAASRAVAPAFHDHRRSAVRGARRPNAADRPLVPQPETACARRGRGLGTNSPAFARRRRHSARPSAVRPHSRSPGALDSRCDRPRN